MNILDKVEFTESCWLWTGCIDKDGYGRVSYDRAHRAAYKQFIGEIPKGLVIDHLCRVRHCVNPEHLEPITRGDNIMRGMSSQAINFNKTHCKNGHEFTAENTYYRGVNKAWRKCRKCGLAADKRHYLKSR